LCQQLQLVRGFPKTHFAFANALRDKGLHDKLVEHYKKALVIDPSFAAVREALEKAQDQDSE
jgi:tetratricopeptide (TPR) repeat protein